MTIAYLQCTSGISGDMTVAAMLDAGMPLEHLTSRLALLSLPETRVTSEKVLRSHISATKFNVEYAPSHHARHLADIEGIIDASALAPRIKDRAKSVFRSLAAAEAKVHDTTIDRIHFHEVGATDAIVDIVSACVGLDYFGIDRLYCSPINVGSGTVKCDHGLLPVPAPATAELLKGLTTYSSGTPGELATPTGAAILSTLAEGCGAQPAMKVESVGYGAGTRETAEPNVLRLFVGEDLGDLYPVAASGVLCPGLVGRGAETDTVLVVETDVDDMVPELVPVTISALLRSGALDAHYASIVMKHGRPGVRLTAVCHEDSLESVVETMLRQTTTLGVRISRANRVKLVRASVKVSTEYGEVSVKLGMLDGKVITASPEHSDCVSVAEQAGASVMQVYEAAKAQYLLKGPTA